MERYRFYGHGLPNVDLTQLKGSLIVVEGGDGAGRSTQCEMLRDSIQRMGFPVIEVGLKRSKLVGRELVEAMQSNVLCPRTLGLFYATDFADQLENVIIPALRAGFVVVADRYIYTLIARDVVRGADRDWIRGVYGFAVVPHLIFYLKVTPRLLAERSLQKNGVLNYWESGMDIQRSGDMHQCFIYYQNRIGHQLNEMKDEFNFIAINGNRDPAAIHREMREFAATLLYSQHQADGGSSRTEPLSKERKASEERGAAFEGRDSGEPAF